MVAALTLSIADIGKGHNLSISKTSVPLLSLTTPLSQILICLLILRFIFLFIEKLLLSNTFIALVQDGFHSASHYCFLACKIFCASLLCLCSLPLTCTNTRFRVAKNITSLGGLRVNNITCGPAPLYLKLIKSSFWR